MAFTAFMPTYREMEDLSTALRTEERALELSRASAAIELAKPLPQQELACYNARLEALALMKAGILDMNACRKQGDEALLKTVCGIGKEELGAIPVDVVARLIAEVQDWIAWEVVPELGPNLHDIIGLATRALAGQRLTGVTLTSRSLGDSGSSPTVGSEPVGTSARTSPTASG